MGKVRTTKKYLKENYRIINAGNGNLQNLLRWVDVDYYCTRAEGWACDAYIFSGYAILDGYDCTGKLVSREIMKEYDSRAAELFDKHYYKNECTYEEFMEQKYNLIMEFADKVTRRK